MYGYIFGERVGKSPWIPDLTLLILAVIVVLTAGFALTGSTRSRSTNHG